YRGVAGPWCRSFVHEQERLDVRHQPRARARVSTGERANTALAGVQMARSGRDGEMAFMTAPTLMSPATPVRTRRRTCSEGVPAPPAPPSILVTCVPVAHWVREGAGPRM